jgi:hypothetical protein
MNPVKKVEVKLSKAYRPTEANEAKLKVYLMKFGETKP